MELYVGIDWATREHQVCLVSPEGKELAQKSFGHTSDGLRELIEWLRQHEPDPSKIAAAIETPQGLVVDALLDAEIVIYTINPKQLDRFRDRHNVAGAKDDRLDAFVLGASLRTDIDLFRRLHPTPETISELRELSRARDDFLQDHQRSCNQLRDLLLRTLPDLLALCPGADAKWLWDVLELADSAKQLRKLKAKQLAPVIWRVKKFTARELEAVLAKPIATAPGVAVGVFRRIRLLLPLVRLSSTQLASCEKQLAELLDELPHKGHRDVSVLLSLPGLGKTLTAVLIADATESLAQRDYQRLRALTGVAPVTQATGKRSKDKAKILMRRSCSDRLRFAMHHWSRAAIPLAPHVRDHYARLRARGHSHGRALRGVGDRLLRIAVAMLRSGETYDPARFLLSPNPC